MREPGETLLARMRDADAEPALELSGRELQILSRLETNDDKAIAAELGLTVSGLRYHVGKLFRKLGARTRKDAVRRAREKGLLTSGSAASLWAERPARTWATPPEVRRARARN